MEESSIDAARPVRGRMITMRVIEIALRWLLGLLFVYAGVTKGISPDAFMADIGRFQLLPGFLLAPTAIYLPYLEIFTGLSLITGIFYRGALLLTKGMLVVFSIGLESAWWRGLEISCRCFGKGWGDLPVQWALLRNILLLAAAAALIHFSLRNRALIPQGNRLFRFWK